MSSPPEDWKNLDYMQANLSELKSDFSGYAGDLSFKTGYGWIDPQFVFENRLRIISGYNPETETANDIALVFVEKWVNIPLIGLKRIGFKDLFRRDGYNLVGSVWFS